MTARRRVGLVGGFLTTLAEVSLLGAMLLFLLAGLAWSLVAAAIAVALHLPWWVGFVPAALFCARWGTRVRRVRR